MTGEVTVLVCYAKCAPCTVGACAWDSAGLPLIHALPDEVTP